MMNLEQSIAYYHSLMRFGMKPGLSRIRALCRYLGNPQERLNYIHIAGTNGKGSVAVMLSEIFRAAGYKTGLFTSPYITCFQERIQIDGVPVDDQSLIEATELVKEAAGKVEKDGETVTEFEAVTAAAFVIFAKAKCDIIILETGLGGRFDATNCIESPLASVITSISLDHTKVLGSTLEQIAFEKSGIIKPERPVFCPDTIPDCAQAVIRRICEEKSAPLTLVEKKDILTQQETLTGFDEIYRGFRFHVPLPGSVQSENAALAVETARHCPGFSVSDKAIRRGIENTKNPARCELLLKNPPILLDGSHNDASTAALSSLLQKQLPDKKILAVMGMMADKDIDKALAHLLPCFSSVITTTPSNQRALDAQSLCEKIREKNVSSRPVPDPIDAVDLGLTLLKNYDAMVVCGSLYLAGDTRRHLMDRIHELFTKGS